VAGRNVIDISAKKTYSKYVIKRILKEAKKALNYSSDHHKLCAIVLDKKNKILSVGINDPIKSHPLQAYYSEKVNEKYKIYLHAEISALIKRKKDPYIMYVVRFFKNGDLALAKPCPVCMEAIKDSGLRAVKYSIAKNEWGEIDL
jgi:tRNA(Arg) A34 adenosine deaminase TadA